MKMMFVYWAFENQGSGIVIQGYTEAAKSLGHEVAVYGRRNSKIPLNYSLDLRSADAVIFIFEWTTMIQYGDQLDLLRLVGKVPRQRRIILDGDGNYNHVISVRDDHNHRDAAAARRWVDMCDSLSDKICQPTFHPLRSNVRPFLFYAYSPEWEVPLDFSAKEYGMVYVGQSKFRWQPMKRVLQVIEPIRQVIGRIGLVGHGWDALPWWAVPMQVEDSYFTDQTYLRKFDVSFIPPVPFEQVIRWMSKAVINPVLLRPTFSEMRLVTPRVFETPAANTIPLLTLDRAYVKEIYGEPALELVLRDDNSPEEQVLDMIRRPERYAQNVKALRRHLAVKHSYRARVQELIEIVKS